MVITTYLPCPGWHPCFRASHKSDHNTFPTQLLMPDQVHRAVSHDGRQLAVKVQHVGLRDTCAADTVIVEAFVKGLRWMFPDFNYQWLIDELKESVPKVQHKHLSFLASSLRTEVLHCLTAYAFGACCLLCICQQTT